MSKYETNLTLIIPTYNRSDWLSCTLKTIANFNLKILVMDGSTSKEHIEKNHKLIEQINHKNGDHLVTHIVSEDSFFERVHNAVNIANTEFCKICADDDLFSIEFISDAINKLKRNKKIASVVGVSASYDLLGRKFLGFTDQYHKGMASSDLFLRGTALSRRSGFFGVMPIKLLRLCSLLSVEAEKFILKDEDNDNSTWAAYRLMELIYRTTVICTGIVEKSDNLMLLRLYHEDNLGGKLAKKNRHLDYFLNKDIVIFLEILCTRISFELDIPVENVRTVIFYDHFSDLSNRFEVIKNEIRLSIKSSEQFNVLNNQSFCDSKSIARLLSFILRSLRQVIDRKEVVGIDKNQVKREADKIINEFLAFYDSLSNNSLY